MIVDLIGYRRHGHSEVDDPTVTQPLMYKAIKEHPPLYQIYAKQIGIEDNIAGRVATIKSEYEAAQKGATQVHQEAADARSSQLLERLFRRPL